MSNNPLADEVWRTMAAVVIDNRDSWKRAVVERSGLPFSRIRILKRLSRQSMSVKELAHAATIDAPAATVAVNDLEERGLVVREIDPANRRCKIVSLTEAGQAMVREIDAITDPAPDALAALDDTELKSLRAILDKLARSRLALSSTAIAALCPPMPDTAPPRRDPEPHNRIRSWAVATPQRRAGVSSGSSSSANGHDSAPWKMLPAVMPSVCSRSAVVFASMHSRPAASSISTS